MERALTPAERRAAVLAALNTIVDPCSAAMAEPIGLADLGLVERVRVRGGRVEVDLLPTSPHCLFIGLFEEEIEARVGALEWVESVAVRLDEGEKIWDEGRVSPVARAKLARRRAALAVSLARPGGPRGRS